MGHSQVLGKLYCMEEEGWEDIDLFNGEIKASRRGVFDKLGWGIIVKIAQSYRHLKGGDINMSGAGNGERKSELQNQLDMCKRMTLRERLRNEDKILYEKDRNEYIRSKTKTRTAMIFSEHYYEDLCGGDGKMEGVGTGGQKQEGEGLKVSQEEKKGKGKEHGVSLYWGTDKKDASGFSSSVSCLFSDPSVCSSIGSLDAEGVFEMEE
eukprot:Nk52_evm27s2011 gene=Nk52_evmTU27s2011